jgi:hypothetical protein
MKASRILSLLNPSILASRQNKNAKTRVASKVKITDAPDKSTPN